MSLLDWATIISSIFTSIGVAVAAYQIRVARIQSIAEFEDGFAKEYRELAGKIPPFALLGVELDEEEKKSHFDELYRYFDICNEQIYLRQRGRIREMTWIFWCDGIKVNFEKPAFRWAWDEIEKTKTSEFSELRTLIRERFRKDPKKW
jgi:hypothetical protein